MLNDLLSLVQGQLGLKPWSSRYGWQRRIGWTVNVLHRPEALPTLGAKLRWVYWRHVRWYNGEVCHRCGRPVARCTNSWWHAPDDLWLAMGGAEFGITCPPCFHDLALDQGTSVHFVACVDPYFAESMDEPARVLHVIPVPNGWSPEQAWEAITRGDTLTDPNPSWKSIEVRDGKLVRLLDGE